MLQLLETFCAVADAGSLNRAAEALHLTQPAVTRQIKALEAQLCAVLLTRTSGGVALTPAGSAVLPHARQALAAVTACRRAAEDASGATGESRLRISAGLMVTMYVLPPVLSQFQARWPGVQITLHPSHHAAAVDRLLAYQTDAAIIGHPLAPPGVRHIPLFEDPLLLLSATGTPFPDGVHALHGAPLLVMPREAGLRKETDRALEQLGIVPKRMEYPTIETLKTALLLGMGPAILPSATVAAERKTGRLTARTLEGWPEPVRTMRAVVRSEGVLPQPVGDLIGLLREHYEAGR